MKSFVLRGGNIFCPLQKKFKVKDLCVKDGRIESQEEISEEDSIIDSQGLIVVPGLVDLHTHAYHDFTVLGVEPNKCCLHRYTTLY